MSKDFGVISKVDIFHTVDPILVSMACIRGGFCFRWAQVALQILTDLGTEVSEK